MTDHFNAIYGPYFVTIASIMLSTILEALVTVG